MNAVRDRVSARVRVRVRVRGVTVRICVKEAQV